MKSLFGQEMGRLQKVPVRWVRRSRLRRTDHHHLQGQELQHQGERLGRRLRWRQHPAVEKKMTALFQWGAMSCRWQCWSLMLAWLVFINRESDLVIDNETFFVWDKFCPVMVCLHLMETNTPKIGLFFFGNFSFYSRNFPVIAC